ncbi:MAG: class I SAM-dependent methyltransferase [Steroidobacteraceae bacterium]
MRLLLQPVAGQLTSWYLSLSGGGTFRKNLARRRPATQSSVSARWSRFHDPQEEARGANNGLIDGSQGFTTDAEHFPWWQVDLGKSFHLQEVRIFNRRDWASRLSHFSILSSLEGDAWVEVYRKADDSVFGDRTLKPFAARLPPGSVGRFVRIQLNGTDYLHFNECQVFGQPVAEAEQPRIESLFQERFLAQRARLNVLPIPPMLKSELDIELMLSQYHYPFPRAELTRTEARRWILEHASPGGVGAEVGVFRGHFSEAILEQLVPSKFYLIDPWENLGEFFGWKDAYTNLGTLPTRVARRDAELRAAKFPNTETVFIQGTFPECKASIREPLDWIYIDASHQYESTLREITESAEILKPGGVILGDDFYPDRGSLHHGVFRAVNAFVKSGLFEFIASGPGGQWCLRRTVARNEAAIFEGGADRHLVDIAARATGQELASARHLLGVIAGVRKLHSVVNFGCGRGSWLHAARALGAVEIRGYDTEDVPLDARGLRPEEFYPADLAQPIRVEKRFDLAVCMDVAQDLTAGNCETLVRTLCGASDWVLFSAAVPYQVGAHHRSAHWPEYWAAIFHRMDFICYDILRIKLWHDTRIAYYYRQSACLYVRSGTQQSLEAKGYRPTANPPALIHPELLLRVSSQAPPAGYQLGAAVRDYYKTAWRAPEKL